jgi:hypothetical protein
VTSTEPDSVSTVAAISSCERRERRFCAVLLSSILRGIPKLANGERCCLAFGNEEKP